MKRRFNYLFIAIIVALFFVGCKTKEQPIENDTTDEAMSLSVAISEFTLKAGDTVTLLPILDGTNKDLEYKYLSDNESVATVDSNGLVTAIEGGEAKITVSLKDYPNIYTEVSIMVALSDNQVAELILQWAKDYVGEEILQPVQFPSTHPDYSSTITWESSDTSILKNTGSISQQPYDVTVSLKISVDYKGIIKSDTIDVVIGGYVLEEVATKFLNQFSNNITRDYEVNTSNVSYPNAKITWYSSNTDIFTNEGKFIKPFNDTEFTIFVTVTFEDLSYSREYSKTVKALGLSIYEKADTVKTWVENQLQINKVVDDDLALPISYEDYNATLEWSSNNPNIMDSNGVLTSPKKNEMMELRCKVIIGNDYASFYINFEVLGVGYTDKWEAVNDLLSFIFKDEITNQRYSVEGVAASYIAYNYGYLPFFVNERSNILDGFMNPTVPGRLKTETRWITIHDTANNNVGADAEMHKNFIQGNPGNVSWHYTVDDSVIYQHVPDEEVAWHAGTAEGNNYGIGIETCIDKGGNYNITMRKTAKLTSELMKEFNLTLYSVRQHNFFSGKDCPHVMRSSNRWNEFLDLVSIEYFGIMNLEGVSFEWQSLTPDILDNTGMIYYHPMVEKDVTYKVSVTYNGETREFTHTSKLLPPSWL